MERQKFRVKRTNANYMNPGPPGFSGFSNPSFPCSGGTNFFPINFSINCLGLPMYASTASQVLGSLSGDMTTYPLELQNCSPTNPCVILWDVITAPTNNYCQNELSQPYVIFQGLQITSGGTNITQGTYDELMTIFPINNADPTQPLYTQVQAYFEPVYQYCLCDDPFADVTLNELTIFLSQDFNDIGHYTQWDGNIDQQDAFSNFVFTADTLDPYKITIYNSTDFGFYDNLKTTPYTIDWGDISAPTILSPTNLTATHTYPNVPYSRRVTITQKTPWGPISTSKIITVPSYNFQALQAITGSPPLQSFAGVPVSGPHGIGSSTAYHGMYGTEGTTDFTPLDSGISILQYSGLAPTVCFEVTGLTQSSLGLFQTYSTGSTSGLAPGYFHNVDVPLGMDVLNPTTNLMESGMVGSIFDFTPGSFTAYTISSANGQTPIDFYDFSNGITVFVALSCGLDAYVFGGEDCYQCEVDPCDWCENVDEYYNPISQTTELISFNTNQGVWNSYTDYQVGDIVFDLTNNVCCCFMAVKEIIQTNPATNSPWAFTPPASTFQGVWYSGGTAQEYLWHACSVDCNPCPVGSSTPCNDPTNPFNTGAYDNSTVYSIGDFAEGPDGNCYQALNNGTLVPPTGGTSQQDWDYVGCVSWVCPPDISNVGPHTCEMISGTTSPSGQIGYPAYTLCIDAWNNNECPTESQWVCIPPPDGPGQFGCGGLITTTPLVDPYPQIGESGCVEITSPNDPQWGSYYNTSPNFTSFTDCALYCNPPAFSCTTPGQPPFCQEISCYGTSNVTPGDYTTIMTNAVTAYGNNWALIASNLQLWVQYTPSMYTIGDCQLDCGDLSGYTWDCEFGCQPTINGDFADFTECANASNNPALAAQLGNPNIGIFPSTGLGGEVPCGWSCTTPYTPYNPPLSSPCTPCYTPACGAPTEIACVNDPDCGITASCIVCDCTGFTDSMGNFFPTPVICDPAHPCPTIDPNTGLPGPNPAQGTYPDTVAGLSACTAACQCDGGWDCALGYDYDTGLYTGIQYDPCQYYNSDGYMVQNDLIWSPGGPYASEEDCCLNTNCCRVKCDDAIPGSATVPNVSSNVNYPCYYTSSAVGLPCLGQINGIWCTMADCLADQPNSASCATQDCHCACSGYLPNTLVDRGVFNNNGMQAYDMYHMVSHTDPDTPDCCFICLCGIGTSPYDCNSFTPDDGPATTPPYQPNCWVSCGSQVWADPTGCPPCAASSGQTFECTPDGCVPSACVYPGPALATIQNCYSGNTCEEECRADCYCDYTVTPAVSSCVQAQQVILGNDPQGVSFPIFPMVDLNDCNFALSSGMNCCSGTTLPPTYHCDDSCYCDDGTGLPCGVGCVPIIDGVPNPYTSYPGAFTSLTQCQEFCTWTCDPQGLQSCIFIANTPPGPTTYDSAADCYTFGPTSANFNDCNCPPTVTTGWYCDTAGAANGTVGNTASSSVCVPESFLVGGGFTSVYLSQAYGPGTPSFATSYQGGSPGFVDQATCESYCRYCCNPTGTTFCELSWGQVVCPITNLSSQPSVFDCITVTTAAGNYPCASTQYEYCCDDFNGCISFVGAMPQNCVLGPFNNLSDCTNECTFSCGDCVNDCECTFAGVPLTTPPCDVYTSMTECQQYLIANPGFNSMGGCCDCLECAYYGNISFWYWDVTTTNWLLDSVSANVPPPALQWNSGQVYSLGDVVIDISIDGLNNDCCYVYVFGASPILAPLTPNTLVAPNQYYQAYNSQYLAGNGVNANNALVWIPCDLACAGTSPPVTYSCSTGPSYSITYDSCGGAIDAGAGPFISTADYLTYLNVTFGPNADFSDYKYWAPCGAPSAVAIHCPVPNQPGMCYKYRNNWKTSYFGNPANLIGGVQSPMFSNYQEVVDWFNLVATTEGYAGGFTTAMSIPDLMTLAISQNTYTTQDYCNAGPTTPWGCTNQVPPMMGSSGGGGGCNCITAATGNSNQGCVACDPGVVCPYTSMTDCELYCERYECITNVNTTQCDCVATPGGSFSSLHDCQTSTANNNCCYTGTTSGPYKCVPNPPGVQPACGCVATPTGNYPTLLDCQGDPLNCCYSGGTAACFDCVDLQFYYWSQQFDNIYSPTQQSPLPSLATYSNTSTGVNHTTPQTWTPNNIWGLSQIVIDPQDQCCYVYSVKPAGIALSYDAVNPSACWYNWLQGLACDGSSNFAVTQVTNDQQEMAVWYPCDTTCPDTPSFDCDPTTYTCFDPGTGAGMYQTLNQCQQDCIPPDTDCDDCATILQPTFLPPVSNPSGFWVPPVQFYSLPPVNGPAIMIPVGGCVHDIYSFPNDPSKQCCHCCVCPGGWIFNGVSYSCGPLPSVVGGNPSAKLAQEQNEDGVVKANLKTQPPCEVKVLTNQFGFTELVMIANSAWYNTGWMSCGVTNDGSPCSDGGSGNDNGSGSGSGTGSGFGSGVGPDGSCIKCCRDFQGNVVQLQPSTNPCRCPDGYLEIKCFGKPVGGPVSVGPTMG